MSGAPLTLLVILLPWFVYIVQHHGWTTFLRELNNNREGGDHGGAPWNYLPWLAMGLLPWTIFVVIALVGLGQALWTGASRELKLLAAWLLAIAIPLAATGNKQVHYLLPLMPPLMILTAWWMNLAIKGAERHVVRIAKGAMIVTAVTALAAAVAMAVYLHRGHYDVDFTNFIAPAVLAVGAIASLTLVRRSFQAGLLPILIATAAVLPILVGYESNKTLDHDPRATAAEIRQRYGQSPLVFYGPNLSLPLCYNLRQSIPSTGNPEELLARLKDEPKLVVILQDKADRTPSAPPAPFVQDGSPVMSDDQVFTFYRVP